MEESEKRRERLKAMRMEAAQAGTHGEAENSMGHGLANPLIEPQPGIAEPYSRPRFDYYTDPMAAYSADKRRSPQVSQPHSTPPRPGYSDSLAYSAQGSYFVDQRPSIHHTFSPLGSPVRGSFSGSLPENPPNVWGTSNFPPSQAQGVHHTFSPLGSPNPPNVWGSPRGTPTSHFPPNSSRFSNAAYGQGGPGFGYGRGRGQTFNSPRPDPGLACSSPYQDSGRGKGRWQGNMGSPGGRGRGSGQRGCSSAEATPYRYYDKSMIEDPWKPLQPTIWKKINTPSARESWLPNSIRAKKARVSEGQVKPSPQQSLAEYLAASFDEAVAEGSSA